MNSVESDSKLASTGLTEKQLQLSVEVSLHTVASLPCNLKLLPKLLFQAFFVPRKSASYWPFLALCRPTVPR